MEAVGNARLGPGIIGQLREALLSAALVIDGVSADALTMPTPCPGWSVSDVINHLTAVTEKFGRFAKGESGTIRQLQGDLVGTRPASLFRRIVADALRAWNEHPEALEATCVLPFGSFDGATAAGINLFDAVIHQWDIAVGAHIDHTMNEELAAVAFQVAELLVTDDARRSGQYAPPGVSRPDAPPRVRLLDLTGRGS